MWRSAAVTLLLGGLVVAGVHAGEARPTPVPDAPAELASPYHQYDLKLSAFQPAPRCPAGVLLHVRINGGRPLRLVLDSGAEFIVIGAKDARSAGLSAGSEMELAGLESRTASVGRAQAVEIGPLSFRNCPVAFVRGKVIEGTDGVIPLSLFSAFRLRLDLPQKMLGLAPYPREEDPSVLPIRGTRKHDLLLVATVLNDRQAGYVVMDTGAFCSAISRETARALGGSPMMPEVRLAAGTGAATGQRVSSPVHFAIADRDFIAAEVVALDLSNLSHHCGVEVMGVLGFPALTHSVLTIDYRAGQVKIESPQSTSARELHRRHDTKPPASPAFR